MTTETTISYKLDLARLTVLAVDSHGESHDLNVGGEACGSIEDLRDLIGQLCEQGAYLPSTRDYLLGRI